MASAVAASAILVAFTVSPGEAGARSGPNLHRFEFARPAMGTVARVIVYAPDVDRAAAAAARAFDRIMALERVFSDYRADSEARRLAAKPPNAWHPVGADLFRLLARAQAIAEASGGAFDVTAGSVFAVWRRARRLAEPPDTAALAAARAAGGFRRLDLDPHHRRVRLRARGMRLDFGGIAKGDAANEALRVLRASGLPRALVAIGGDLAAGDPPPDRA
ncbi:MAG TPA: FAD:protein FMN transferase, partial [Vicinamibacterales bacterium]|nr:FAD:protein FMN transferase [Vicinamibacterales bacterium]